jgi:hypothetical protein
MFATIRRYTATTSIPQKEIDEFRHLISDGFLPMVKDIEGFHAYHLFVSEKELCTVSVFETRKGAAESTRRAAEFVRKTPLPLQLGAPEVIEGDVLISLEAARMVGAH